jgi:hypothetical protein
VKKLKPKLRRFIITTQTWQAAATAKEENILVTDKTPSETVWGTFSVSWGQGQPFPDLGAAEPQIAAVAEIAWNILRVIHLHRRRFLASVPLCACSFPCDTCRHE